MAWEFGLVKCDPRGHFQPVLDIGFVTHRLGNTVFDNTELGRFARHPRASQKSSNSCGNPFSKRSALLLILGVLLSRNRVRVENEIIITDSRLIVCQKDFNGSGD